MEWKHCLVHEKPKQKVPMLWRSDSAAHFFKGWPLLGFFVVVLLMTAELSLPVKIKCCLSPTFGLNLNACGGRFGASLWSISARMKRWTHCACGWINQKSETRKFKSLPKTIFPLNYHSETGFVAVIVEGRDKNETVLKCSHFTQKTKHRLTGGLAWGSSPIKNKEKKK